MLLYLKEGTAFGVVAAVFGGLASLSNMHVAEIYERDPAAWCGATCVWSSNTYGPDAEAQAWQRLREAWEERYGEAPSKAEWPDEYLPPCKISVRLGWA